jgi:hypothetical protein
MVLIQTCWRLRRCRPGDDKFGRNPEALADPPLLDRMHVAGAGSRPSLVTESRPSERDGAAHKRRITGLVGIGVGQRCREAAVIDGLKLCISTETREGVLLAETKE